MHSKFFFFENRHDDMQKLGSNFIVRRSHRHRSKALDEIFSMARSMGVHYTKFSSKVAKTQTFQIFSPPIELFDPNLGLRCQIGSGPTRTDPEDPESGPGSPGRPDFGSPPARGAGPGGKKIFRSIAKNGTPSS